MPPSRPDTAARTTIRHRSAVFLAAMMGAGLLSVAPGSAAPAVPSDVSGRERAAVSAALPGAPVERRGCAKQGKPFRPTTLGIKSIITPRTVLALGRDSRGVPQAPPLSDAGKRQFAWDAQDAIKVGSKHGVIKMNAHTYPDGSALGNTLINQLYPGNRMVVRGARGQLRCYDVVDRVQITAERRYARYYRTDGPGRLAIAVCSGVRRGPGDWSHRTIWFAKPVR